MILIKILLLPLFPILYAIIKIRNLLYDLDFITISQTPVKSVCVGNLKVGGTGKTPFTNMIISQFPSRKNLAFLSRGYGRKSSGFVEATKTSTADDIGDEPKMISLYYDDIVTCVCENRAYGAHKILSLHPNIKFMILDDAFQHRSIKATQNILLTEYNHPYFKDFLFPLGSLRDVRSSAKRANIIVVTKSPSNITNAQMDEFVKKMNPESYQKIFFSTIEYSELRQMTKESISSVAVKKGANVITVAGIANSSDFENEMSKNYKIIKSYKFKDHHNYTIGQLEAVANMAIAKNAFIITTAKDAAKWINMNDLSEGFRSRVYIQDIKYKIIDYKGGNINSLFSDITKY